MSDAAHELIAPGRAALARADWRDARAAFEAALVAGDDPEAHDGLGVALWWLNEVALAHEHRAAAYRGFRRRGQPARAALIAAWLAREQVFLRGNSSAMAGWFARADGLLREAGACPEQGWVLLFRASMSEPPAGLELAADAALELARRYGDGNLEAMALAFGGLALAATGRVAEGMARLDEAMAMVTAGELDSFMAISEIFCVLLSACALAGDLVRTEQWCESAAEFARRYSCAFLSAYCRTTYGGLLAATGRWGDAEAELLEAMRAFERGHRALRVHAALQLAELRVWQGRLEEAGLLLDGYEDHGAAALPRARLHLALGEPELARAVIDQAIGGAAPSLGQLQLLTLRVEVLLALGDHGAAGAAADGLLALAEQSGSSLLLAQAELARGAVLQRAGAGEALRCYERALELLRAYEQSLLASRARLAMARSLQASDRAGAIVWARAALASFERLGAAQEADAAAQLLRELGAAGRAGPRQREPLSQREDEVLALVARGLTNREIAARLVISGKTVEHHVSQILAKLGLRSRAEAAAYAARHARGDPDPPAETNQGRR